MTTEQPTDPQDTSTIEAVLRRVLLLEETLGFSSHALDGAEQRLRELDSQVHELHRRIARLEREIAAMRQREPDPDSPHEAADQAGSSSD